MPPRFGPSRGEPPATAASSYREYAAPDTLRPYIECFWTREVTPSATGVGVAPPHRVLPDGCIDVVLAFSEHGDEPESAMIVGTMTRALVLVPTRDPSCFVGVRFRPARATAFLSLPASELTDLRVSIGDLWPDAEAVREALAASPEALARAQALERVLTARLTPTAPAGAHDVDEAVRRIVEAGGSLGITRLAPALGVTRQHLARRFAQLVGVSPKTFARVVRLGRVVERARLVPAGAPINWSALALEIGYYDQSHLVDEFREMTGLTPTAWRSVHGG
jgi:AraC-like DNA-binding protein